MKHLSALFLLFLTGCATKPTIPPRYRQGTPDYMSLKTLDQELNFANRWHGGGTVIIGRLDLPKDAEVTSRTRIFPDGSFAAAVAPGRELAFYAHGYDPLKAKIYDAGTLGFSRAAPDNLRSVKFTVSMADPGVDAKATIQLIVYNHSFLFQDAGHSGGHVELVAETKLATNGQAVIFTGLSRNPYKLVFTAPGHITQYEIIDPKQDGVIDLGHIDLIKAKTLEITYRTRVRRNGGEWITDQQPKRATIVCDGTSELRFSDIRTGLGAKLDLRLLPSGNDVYASFFYTGADFFSLGVGSISDVGEFDSIAVDESVEADNGVKLESGGLYYFRVKDLQDTDIEMVFQPKEI